MTDIKQAIAELREVVEKLKAASSLSVEEYNNHGCWASMEIRDNITAALALLQAEKELSK